MGLVLSRRLDQRILIGNDITVTVLRIDKGVVRLLIDAPADVLVLRQEVYERYNQRYERNKQRTNVPTNQGESGVAGRGAGSAGVGAGDKTA